MNIGIVGCGLIGRKRTAALSACGDSQVVIVADIDAARAEQPARQYGCHATIDWEQVVRHPEVEAVIVSTVNNYLMPITVAALEKGKHVLVEKPMARNLVEAEAILQAAGYRRPTADRRMLPDFSTFIHTNAESTALIFELIVSDRRRYPVQKIVFASSQSVCGEGRYSCRGAGEPQRGGEGEKGLGVNPWAILSLRAASGPGRCGK